MPRKKKKINDDFTKPSMTVVKQNIKKCFRDKSHILIIDDYVKRINLISFHCLAFLKLYFSHLYVNNISFETITLQFISNVFKVISIKNPVQGRQPNELNQYIIDNLTKFRNDHYKQCLNDFPTCNKSKLSNFLQYEAISIVTSIETNIKEHYIDYLRKFILYVFAFDLKFASIKENKKKLSSFEKHLLYVPLNKDIDNILTDFLNVSDKKLISEKKYHKLIKKYKWKIICEKNEYSKNSINYDICVNPQDYLPNMFYINNKLESLITDERQIKLYNVMPLKLSLIPSYITIDSFCLAQMFNTENTSENCQVSKNKKSTWDKYCCTEKKWFKKTGYEFNYMIKTDGYACSILFENGTKENRKYVTDKKKFEERYIEDVENIEGLIEKNHIVTLDQGVNALISCVRSNNPTDAEDKKNKTFEYSSKQRKHMLKTKKYMEEKEELKKTTKIEGESIKTIEKKLNKCNFRTCNFEELKKSLEIKCKINKILKQEYEKPIHRKYKWYSYINRQKADTDMINKFRKAMGEPEKTIVVIGDWDQRGKYNKNSESSINRRTKQLLRKEGYEVYLINEHNTSKLCNKCEEVMTQYVDKKGKEIWGLKCCKNSLCKPLNRKTKKVYKERIYNRDINAALNMLKIVNDLRKTGKRPHKYTRNNGT